MRNKQTMLIIILLLVIFPNVSSFEMNKKTDFITSGIYEKGYRYNIQGWVYLHIEGEPYDRGYQYGYLAANEIIDMIQRWSNLAHDINILKLFLIKNLPKNYDKLSEFWWKICRTKSMRFFEKHIPMEYKQEIKGITDGMNAQGIKLFGRNITYEDIVASQFVQEVLYAFFKWNFRRFHPIRNLINTIKETNYEDFGHCRAIIATGDATADCGVVVAHATIFYKYIAQRCNFILDIKPSNGYRFIMTCPPGSLWSQEDYYQNEKGIILTETELVPQGPFNIRKTPKGIRSRTAIQYSSSIDEVIEKLQKGNNGLIPNEWLIADTKTKEIARLEQALYNTVITRTKNGVFTSSSVPHNDKIEKELWGLIPKALAVKLFPGNNKYTSFVIKKFDVLIKNYYGKIDVEIIKKILTTNPISNGITDIKITNSKLMKNIGLITYFGNPNETQWIPKDNEINKFKGVTVLPSTGWVEIIPFDSEPVLLQKNGKNNGFENSGKVLLNYETENIGTIDYSSNIVDDDIVYTAISTGSIYAINNPTGKKVWSKNINEKIVDFVINDNLLYLGTNTGLYAINKKTGNMEWEQKIGEVVSKPIVYKNFVISGFSDGEINAFDLYSGKNKQLYKFDDVTYISEIVKDTMYICSGQSCYSFNVDKKEINWESKTKAPTVAAPKIDQETVYFGSWDGYLYALNASTGLPKWKFKTGWGIVCTPFVTNESVFIGSLDNNFYALNKNNGNIIWYFTCNAAIHSNPIVYGEYVFFGCDDGRFYALNKTNGVLAWSFAPKYCITNDNAYNYITTPILSNPFVNNSIVYFGANGCIYALDTQTYEKEKQLDERTDNNCYIFLIVIFIIAIFIYSFIKRMIRG
ncbi:MAG: PQQ-binding-like beta-propeller repeat protein [Thermoplasmatota archaeon]